jgi:hypothetical protein
VEEVLYNDHAPWPAAADGSGFSLQRRSVGFGNSPSTWVAAAPTPGRLLDTADSDGDGLPDVWELQHGTSPYVPDADQDPDADGLTNWQEYLAGTDPFSAASNLRLEFLLESGTGTLRFSAVSNRTYTVLSRLDLAGSEWVPWTNVPAAGFDRAITFPVQAVRQSAFYRLVTPAQP